jgi:flagella basal body P-ring formation protein FlgA
MLRWLSFGACLFAAFAADAFADPVMLRARVESTGPSVTLGDLFIGAGDVSNRAIAPAPAAGQVSTLPMAVIVAAASGAGLDFTPPAGVTDVQVVHPAGPRAFVQPADAQRTTAQTQTPARAQAANGAIRRGQVITLSYQVGGLSLTTRVQAMEDADVGQSVRLTNPSSNRVVIATVTGPGAASASP